MGILLHGVLRAYSWTLIIRLSRNLAKPLYDRGQIIVGLVDGPARQVGYELTLARIPNFLQKKKKKERLLYAPLPFTGFVLVLQLCAAHHTTGPARRAHAMEWPTRPSKLRGKKARVWNCQGQAKQRILRDGDGKKNGGKERNGAAMQFWKTDKQRAKRGREIAVKGRNLNRMGMESTSSVTVVRLRHNALFPWGVYRDRGDLL